MRVYRPSEPLRPYVRYYWVASAAAGLSVLTFPTGCPQMIFHRKSPLYIPELGCRQEAFTVSGQVNFPAHVATEDDAEMVVAVFYPHTFGLLAGVSPAEFYNREVSGFDLGNRSLGELARRVLECGDGSGECVAMVDRWLSGRLSGVVVAPSASWRRAGAALRAMAAEPSVRVGELAEVACLGVRQFERVFRECVGMLPKEYARVVRFQRAMWMMQRGERDWAEIAYGCGYADQSHFIREFRRFGGMSPGAMLRDGVQPYSDLFACLA